jgi:phosphate transport system protein
MLQELLKIFRGGDPLRSIADNFSTMLELARDNILLAGDIFFNNKIPPANLSQVYKQDIKINKMQRTIRRQVATHLSMTTGTMDVPYCLAMMSLVKDVERLGDYAKNIVELVDLHPDPLPGDELVDELKEIRAEVENILRSTHEVLVKLDRETALGHIRCGKDLARRCDAMLGKVARSDYKAGIAAVMVLATRYYKRIGGHLINILSSVVMPLHKVDYYDENDIRKLEREGN